MKALKFLGALCGLVLLSPFIIGAGVLFFIEWSIAQAAQLYVGRGE